MSDLDIVVERFLAEDPGGPVVMLNLLRFRPVDGAQKYAAYMEQFAATGIEERYGVEVVYGGVGSTPLVADDGQQWDMVALVRYPSRRHFAEMANDPDYQAFAHLRTEALAATVLQPTTPVFT